MAILVLVTGSRIASADDVLLELAVEMNGRPIGKIGEFVSREGMLLSRRTELGELGFQIPQTPSTADALLPLSSIPGVTWRVDTSTMTLHVTAANDALTPLAIRPTTPAAVRGDLIAGLGATMNYDVVDTVANGRSVTAGSFDFRVFSPWGAAGSTLLAYAGGGPRPRNSVSAIRLDTSYTSADPDTLRQYVVGDLISGSLSMTRPIRMGGLQISSNFALRPDLVTFPLPSVSGTVAVPSTLDVLVNGNRYVSRAIDAGPFEVPQLPVVSGAGTVSMTLTDALGQQVSVNLPTYASAELLAPGLSAYSVQVGAVRHDWGTVSDNYRNLAASATYRYGVTPSVTLEAVAEAGSRLAMGGAGMVLNVADLAVLHASVQSSAGAQRGDLTTMGGPSGLQYFAGLQRIGRILSIGGSATLATRGFRDLAAANGEPVQRLRINGNAGLSLGRFGSIGVSYAGVVRSAARSVRTYVPPGLGSSNFVTALGGFVEFQQPLRTSLVSASYSVQLGSVSGYITAYKDLVRGGGAGGVIGLSMPLGGRSSIGSNTGLSPTGAFGEVQVQQTALLPGDWGYRASVSRDTSSHAFADTDYRTSFGQLTAGVDRSGQHNGFRVGARGALSYAGDQLFASDTVQDSFAVIDTDGVPGIRVLQENRDVGRTDAAGKLFVTNLRSFEVNRLAIEPTDIAQDTSVAVTQREVRPQYHSGIVVRFPMQASGGALVRLVDEAAAPLPLGSVARLGANGPKLPVGFDGEAYVENLQGRNVLRIELPDGKQCEATFEYHAVPGEIPKIGPIVCQGRATVDARPRSD